MPGGAAAVRAPQARLQAALTEEGNPQLRDGNLRATTTAVDLLVRVAPKGDETRRLQQALNDRRAQVSTERAAFADLLRGEYRKVLESAAPLVDAGRASPRPLFYAACSRAALSLTAAPDGQAALVDDARCLFARATAQGASFARDETHISPAILAVLKPR